MLFLHKTQPFEPTNMPAIVHKTLLLRRHEDDKEHKMKTFDSEDGNNNAQRTNCRIPLTKS